MNATRSRADAELSDFQSRWLTEAVRQWEALGERIDDSAALAAAQADPGDPERRIRLRAERLARQHGWLDPLLTWQMRARAVLTVLLGLALIGGFAGALGVLGLGERPINVLWALLALLGPNTLMLALWLASLGFADGRDGGALGRFWLWLSRRRRRGPDPGPTVRGLFALLAPTGLPRWLLGAVGHWLWFAGLFGALAGLLLALMLWQYGFVWRTTILPGGAFVAVVEAIGWLPARLGFPVPGPDLVRASGGMPLADEAARRAWSGWLLGALVVHGLLPRLLLALVCQWRFALGRRRLRLNLDDPYYTTLAARLTPTSERTGVVDAERAAGGAQPRLAAPRRVGNDRGMLIGLELRDEPPGWPGAAPNGLAALERIDTRDERHRLLHRLAADPPARLLLACDPRLSPDRGSLALIAALSEQAGECRLWLLGLDGDEDRRRHWIEALTELGLAPEHLYSNPAPALAWARGSD